MSLYAEQPARRTRQAVGDALVLAWVVAWVAVGRAVHDQVARLAEPGRTLESAGTSLEDGLRSAGEGVSQVPLLGDELRAPFDSAGGAAGTLTDAGLAFQDGVARAALIAGIAVAVWPVVVVAGLWIAGRVRFARRSSAARVLLDDGAGVDLFALRALAHAPLRRLAAVSADPAGDWRRGDPDVVRALAELDLRGLGLRLPEPATLTAAPDTPTR